MAQDLLNDISQFAKILEGLLRFVEQNNYDITKDSKTKIAWGYMQKITR